MATGTIKQTSQKIVMTNHQITVAANNAANTVLTCPDGFTRNDTLVLQFSYDATYGAVNLSFFNVYPTPNSSANTFNVSVKNSDATQRTFNYRAIWIKL